MSSISLAGIDITSHTKNVRILKQLDKVSFTLSLSLVDFILDKTYIRNPNTPLVVTIGNEVISFIITESSNDYHNNISIIAKTAGCLLQEPFEKVEDREYQGNSSQILSSISPNIVLQNVASFDFNNATMSIKGTDETTIRKICNTMGANFYEKNNNIIISKPLHIPKNSIPSLSFLTEGEELYSYSETESGNVSNNISKVRINTTYKDVYSTPLLTLIIENCLHTYIGFNPQITDISQVQGVQGSLIEKRLAFKKVIKDERTFILDSSIKSIAKVEIDNVAVPYFFQAGHNVLILDNLGTGTLDIEYFSIVLALDISSYNTDIEKQTYNIQAYYENQFLDVTWSACASTASDTQQKTTHKKGACWASIPSKISRYEDFVFDVSVGGLVGMTFSSSSLAGVNSHTVQISTQGTFDKTFIDGIHRIEMTQTQVQANTIQDVSSVVGHTALGFYSSEVLSNFRVQLTNVSMSSMSYNGQKLYYLDSASFNEFYEGESCHAQYTQTFERWTIPAPRHSEVKRLDIVACGKLKQLEYPKQNGILSQTALSGGGLQTTMDTSCTLPITLNIDMSEQLQLRPADVANKTIYTTASVGIQTIDSFGFLILAISTAEKIEFDCRDIANGLFFSIDTTNMH